MVGVGRPSTTYFLSVEQKVVDGPPSPTMTGLRGLPNGPGRDPPVGRFSPSAHPLRNRFRLGTAERARRFYSLRAGAVSRARRLAREIPRPLGGSARPLRRGARV